jgi:hypothetical protein
MHTAQSEDCFDSELMLYIISIGIFYCWNPKSIFSFFNRYIIYMSSNEAQPSPIVDIYCSLPILAVLGWTQQLEQIKNMIPRGWDSSKDGDGKQICQYAGDLMNGANILSSAPKGFLTAICQFGLPETYVAAQLWGNVYKADRTEESMSCNMILIQRDIHNGQTTYIRGMSLIKITHRPDSARGFYGTGKKLTIDIMSKLQDKSTVEMEVLVLGNATPPGVMTRSIKNGEHKFSTGGRTIRAIQLIGAKLPRGIGLHALETVITLYYKYGWRFMGDCGSGYTQSPIIKEGIKNLGNFFGEHGVPSGLLQTGNEYDKVLTSLLSPFRGFAYHLPSAHAKSTEDLEYLEEYKSSTLSEARDNGYRMLLCQELNAMAYPANNKELPQDHQNRPEMPNKTRGGRRRKRTKKRALKKKNRRTRRKRRKGRKGGRKLTKRKCRRLKGQHIKLAHALNRVSQAIQHQCRK